MSEDRRTTALPKYVQLSELLIRDIAAGRLADGSRLPPERDLSKQMNVSIGTLRKALARIEEMGLLERIQGSGNYVRAREGVPSVYSLLRIELVTGGGLPTAELLSVDRLPKPEGAPFFGPSDEGWRFRRLRFLNETPAAMEEIWLDASRAESVVRSEVSESLYVFYREKLDLVIARAEDRVSLAPMPSWVDARLAVPAGAAAGYIERVSRDTAHAPVEYSRTWFNTQTVHYVSRMGTQ